MHRCFFAAASVASPDTGMWLRPMTCHAVSNDVDRGSRSRDITHPSLPWPSSCTLLRLDPTLAPPMSDHWRASSPWPASWRFHRRQTQQWDGIHRFRSHRPNFSSIEFLEGIKWFVCHWREGPGWSRRGRVLRALLGLTHPQSKFGETDGPVCVSRCFGSRC
jgi:hypothetical protein